MSHPQDRPPDNLDILDDRMVERDLDEEVGIVIKRGSVKLFSYGSVVKG